MSDKQFNSNNTIVNIAEDIVLELDSSLHTNHPLNDWSDKKVTDQEFKTLETNFIFPKFYKQDNVFKGTQLDIDYLNKVYGTEIHILEDEHSVLFNHTVIDYRMDTIYKYDGTLDYGNNENLFSEKESEKNCSISAYLEINIDDYKLDTIDLPAVTKDLQLRLRERLYSCLYFEKLHSYISAYDIYKDVASGKTNEQEKITHTETHYIRYDGTLKYGQIDEGRAYYYGQNWTMQPKFEISKSFKRPDQFELYYQKDNNFYYTKNGNLSSDKKERCDYRYVHSRYDVSSISPTPKIVEDYGKDGKLDAEHKVEETITLAQDMQVRFYGDGLKYDISNRGNLYSIIPYDEQEVTIKRKITMYYGHKSNTLKYYNSAWDDLHNKVVHPKYELNGSYVCYEAEYNPDKKEVTKEKNCLWDNFKHIDYYQKIHFYGDGTNPAYYAENMEQDKYVEQVKIENSPSVYSGLRYDGKTVYSKTNNLVYKKETETKQIIESSNKTSDEYKDSIDDIRDEQLSYGVRDNVIYYYRMGNKAKYTKHNDLRYIKDTSDDNQEFEIKRNKALVYKKDSGVYYYNSVMIKSDNNLVLHPYYGYKGVSYVTDGNGNLIKEKPLLWNLFNFVDGQLYYGQEKNDNVEYYQGSINTKQLSSLSTKMLDYFEAIDFDGKVKYRGIDVTFRYRTSDKYFDKQKQSISDKYDDEVSETELDTSSINTEDDIAPRYSGKHFYTKHNNLVYVKQSDDVQETVKKITTKLEYKKDTPFRYNGDGISRFGQKLNNIKYRHNKYTINIQGDNQSISKKTRLVRDNYIEEDTLLYNGKLKYDSKRYYIGRIISKLANSVNNKDSSFIHNLYDGSLKYNGKHFYIRWHNTFEKFKATIKISHDKEYENYLIIKDDNYYDLAPFINEENKNHDEDYYLRIIYESES